MSRMETLALAIACLLVASMLIWVSPPPPAKQTQSRESLSEAQGRQTGGIPRRFASLSFNTDNAKPIPQSRNLEQRLAAIYQRNPDFNHRQLLQRRVPARDDNPAAQRPLSTEAVKLKMQLLTLTYNEAPLKKLQDFAIACGSNLCRLEGVISETSSLPVLTQTIKKAWPHKETGDTVPPVYVQAFNDNAGRVSLYISEDLEALLPEPEQT